MSQYKLKLKAAGYPYYAMWRHILIIVWSAKHVGQLSKSTRLYTLITLRLYVLQKSKRHIRKQNFRLVKVRRKPRNDQQVYLVSVSHWWNALADWAYCLRRTSFSSWRFCSTISSSSRSYKHQHYFI